MMDVLAMRGCSHACPPVNIQSVGRGENGEGEMGGEGKKNGMKVWFKNLRYVGVC